MEVLPSHKLLSRLYLLLPLHFTALLLLSLAYSPLDNYFINCGAHSNTDVDTRVFVGDWDFLVEKGEAIKNNNSSASTSPLYRVARIFQHQASYKFDINQNDIYIIRLHFIIFMSLYTDRSIPPFNVSVSGFSLLTNYSFQNVTSSSKIEEFLLTIPKGEFKINFVPYEPSSAFVNAIEVVLGPESFIPDKAPHITSQGTKSDYSGLSTKVLHKIHRIDVGGSASKLDDNSSLPKVSWSFPVNKNSNNFRRVHVSGIISVSTLNDYWFNLSINRNFSKEMNPYGITKRIGVDPFHIDFVVDSDGLGFVNASIIIGQMEGSWIYNALLTGLEILEVVNESGFIPHREIVVGKKKYSLVIIGSACIGAFFILVILVALGFSSNSRLTQRAPSASLANPSLKLSLRVPFSEILGAMRNFNAQLLIGEGGFRKVYKGTLKNGTKVAVKRRFQTEIMVLSRIHHRHLVSLIGYCDEHREMLLVYEFMENRILRDHLYHSDDNSGKSTSVFELSWEQRLKICIDAAKGLHYLHSGSAGGIIHRDVKSTNILLDEHYVAKVADFGISKSGLLDRDNFTMGVKGSFGYLDPEYIKTLHLTDKSDVNLAEWGMLWQKKGQLKKIIDPMLVGNIKPSSLRIFGDTAEMCLKAFSIERPTMQDFPIVLNFPIHEDVDAPSRGDDSSNTKVSEA
ncbi:hypothetical protein CIPAW_01G010300 [Carya illinoinensis]|uniref:Protein kinase domain-containing protein n=1 Tax=Carya illinoinensis TaxID=32201 RepID=A0A8T1RIH9_CARIL|nr:hypothetical protein CIPAW_01G010300 [Carya illinoinensis]